ncbi:MAG: hypothetical protein OXN86_11225 [Chloroflexota bacterium]|nr:hypothetical protein [Chloroflexota bacterium]
MTLHALRPSALPIIVEFSRRLAPCSNKSRDSICIQCRVEFNRKRQTLRDRNIRA